MLMFQNVSKFLLNKSHISEYLFIYTLMRINYKFKTNYQIITSEHLVIQHIPVWDILFHVKVMTFNNSYQVAK